MMETQQTPTPPPAPRPGRLIRPHDSNVIAGVATGIARFIDVPVWLVRLGFAALTIAGGLGFVAYAAGWLFMPREGEADSIGGRLLNDVERRRSWGAVLLIALAVMIVTGSTGLVEPDLVFAAILVVVGVLLYRGRLGESGTESPAGEQESGTDTENLEGPEDQPSSGELANEPVRRPPEPRRPRSTLGRWTIALTFIGVGILGLIDAFVPDVDFAARHYVGSVLAGLGVGLVVGAWIGRARGLVFLGVLLIPALIVSPLSEFDLGDSRVRLEPTSVSEIEPEYSFDVGEAVIDLREVDFEDQSVQFRANMGLGELLILVPPNVAVETVVEAGIGEAQAFGESSGGIGSVRVGTSRPGEVGNLNIDANVGIGRVEVSDGDASLGRVDLVIDTPDELEAAYAVDVGSIHLDMSDLVIERPRSVEVRADGGSVSLVLPSDTATRVNGSVDVGTIRTPDGRVSGPELSETFETDANPILTLDVIIDVGELVVEEAR